jgi:branched-chain amino acid transport system ATP-binding protein
MLEVVDLARHFGGIKALDGVSLEIKRGSIVGLIGPNGSGKTTLFNVVTGFYEPTRGEVWFDGERIDGLNPNEIYLRGLVRTFQIPRLFHSLSVLENVLVTPPHQIGELPLNALFKNKWASQEVDLARQALNVLEMLGLTPYTNVRVSDLSAAHIKLLETARSLMGEAKLLLLDEPTAGVAYTTARQLFDFIVRLRDEKNLTFFIIEHRLEVLMDYVEYVYVLHNGKLLSEGKPEEVIEDKKVIEAYIGEG